MSSGTERDNMGDTCMRPVPKFEKGQKVRLRHFPSDVGTIEAAPSYMNGRYVYRINMGKFVCNYREETIESCDCSTEPVEQAEVPRKEGSVHLPAPCLHATDMTIQVNDPHKAPEPRFRKGQQVRFKAFPSISGLIVAPPSCIGGKYVYRVKMDYVICNYQEGLLESCGSPTKRVPRAKSTRAKAPTKQCERCAAGPAVVGERFCKECRKAVLSEMKSAGFLQSPTGRRFRSSEARESTHETKHGPRDF